MNPTYALLLSIATIGAAIGTISAWRRLRSEETGPVWIARFAVIGAGLIPAGLLAWRALENLGQWGPLHSHLDGLLMLCTLLAGMIAYMQWTGKMRGVDHFALPVLTVLLAWAVCASWWTFREFNIVNIWSTIHTASVYLGALAMTIAAAAGAMYLFVRHQLKGPGNPATRLHRLGRLASLEALENSVIHAATFGFLLITLGLISGVVVAMGEDITALGRNWWTSPKVLLATVTWVIYTFVMHVNFAPSFRGRRAAILAIVGFILLFAVFGIAVSLPDASEPTTPAPSGPSLERAIDAEGGA